MSSGKGRLRRLGDQVQRELAKIDRQLKPRRAVSRGLARLIYLATPPRDSAALSVDLWAHEHGVIDKNYAGHPLESALRAAVNERLLTVHRAICAKTRTSLN